MPKLYKPRQIIKALRRAGFQEVSQKGSHIKLAKKTEATTLTVIVPDHSEVAHGTFRSILKQAQITVEEFEALL